MRRLLLLAVLAVGLAACGSSSSGKSVAIKFGIRGGNILPYRVSIAPGGAVTSIGTPPVKPESLSGAKDAELSQLVRRELGKLKSVQCTKTTPDVASRYITALGRTVTVHGDCEPRFTRLWDELTNAFSLNS